MSSMNGNKWPHSLRLRELNGFDEEFLADTASDLASPTKTTELLARVSRLETDFGQPYSHDSISSLTENPSTKRKCPAQVPQQDIADAISKMSIGDRTALLLNLRRLTLGEILKCEIYCPLCSNIISLDLAITNLLQPSEFDPKTNYEIKVDNFNLVVRLPNGKDQEAIRLLERNANDSAHESSTRKLTTHCTRYYKISCNLIRSTITLQDVRRFYSQDQLRT